MLEFFGSIILLVCLVKAAAERDKYKALGVFFIMALLMADLNMSQDSSHWLMEGSRIFVYRSCYELALVSMLYFSPCKEVILVMGLSLISVTINMIGFSFDSQGINPDWIINPLLMAVFYAMLAILLSKRLTNGVYRYLTSVSFVRSYCNAYLKTNSESK